ncbi:hypothetical protein Acr_27g0007540 [Actinidia rufa]|uniref:Uncharacterized protein n=1 Tax=Actinidia rufa TaxID=165716 RepID=A0A7J0H7U7_9ERIC|nr:hypothetical protein Acr_27g0007540 [Actinidia rufa]
MSLESSITTSRVACESVGGSDLGDEGVGGGGGEARRCRVLEDKCWLVARCWRWWWVMARCLPNPCRSRRGQRPSMPSFANPTFMISTKLHRRDLGVAIGVIAVDCLLYSSMTCSYIE